MPEIVIDLSGVGAALVQAIIGHAGELGTALWAAFATWLYSGMRELFLTLMRATLLLIPHTLTDQFGPVVRLMPNPVAIAAAGASLSMALLGLKVVLQRTPIHSAVVEGVLGRIVFYVAAIAVMPWFIARAIDIEQQLAQSISIETIESLTPQASTVPLGIVHVVAWLVLIVLGVRLWFKLASNVVHVATAVIWSPIAGVCGLFPQTESIARMWCWEFFGRLAGALLATVAVGLGLAIAVMYPGLISIAMGGGAFLAAADLVDWLARTPGQRMGGVLGLLETGAQAGMAMARTAGGGGTGSRAAIPQNQITTRAEMFGFD